MYLRQERNESLETISAWCNLSISQLYELEKSAKHKVDAAKERGELFHGFEPIYPDENDNINW